MMRAVVVAVAMVVLVTVFVPLAIATAAAAAAAAITVAVAAFYFRRHQKIPALQLRVRRPTRARIGAGGGAHVFRQVANLPAFATGTSGNACEIVAGNDETRLQAIKCSAARENAGKMRGNGAKWLDKSRKKGLVLSSSHLFATSALLPRTARALLSKSWLACNNAALENGANGYTHCHAIVTRGVTS